MARREVELLSHVVKFEPCHQCPTRKECMSRCRCCLVLGPPTVTDPGFPSDPNYSTRKAKPAPESVLLEAARLVDGARAREQKLEQHDEWAHGAVRKIIDWLEDEERLLVSIARGRHAEGSLRYGDRLMYEYTQDELLAEASQELGDAINYLALWLARNAEMVDE